MEHRLKRQQRLKSLLIASIISTAIHLSDNYLYIEKYPQPESISSSSIYLSWIIWTAIALIGYGLYKRDRFWLSYSCLIIYSFCGIDSLGHYLYGAMSEFSVKMHLFIATDGLAGLAILGFVLWSSAIALHAIVFANRTPALAKIFQHPIATLTEPAGMKCALSFHHRFSIAL